ncbi:hypothetical protein [Demequina mangrovi]|uniref:Uncharacterized protein n=1 Tax=Demequina mangrovi TaxID=1043493 RepID=A0A1H6USY2_9MICO|nr:hypothetical protein [Demequina mangrovi]SEI91155.1 hypothetical protein SAMN05421637_0387 [Demequina mangrovi]
MWDAVLGPLIGEVVLGLLGLEPSPRQIAKQRARGIIVAHTRSASGRVDGLKPFWESRPRWQVDAGELRRRERVIAVVSVDEAARVPSAVEEQVIGPSMSVLTLRTRDAAIEIALSVADAAWLRARLAGEPADYAVDLLAD